MSYFWVNSSTMFDLHLRPRLAGSPVFRGQLVPSSLVHKHKAIFHLRPSTCRCATDPWSPYWAAGLPALILCPTHGLHGDWIVSKSLEIADQSAVEGGQETMVS